MNKPQARWTEDRIQRKIQKWLSGQFLSDVIRYQLESHDGQWRLQFDFEQAAFERLLGRRLGRTVLLSNRLDWTAEQVVAGCKELFIRTMLALAYTFGFRKEELLSL